jgi:carboxypeptidase Taq
MNLLQKLEQYSAACAFHFSLGELFTWENRQSMPSGGAAYRQSMMQFYGDQAHETRTGGQARDLLAHLEQEPPSDPVHQAMLRELRRNLSMVNVPAALMAERQAVIAQATAAWEEANRANDARIWLPHIQRIMDNSRSIAEYAAPGIHPFEFWLNQYEFDLSLAELDNLFSNLRGELQAILNSLPDRGSGSPLPDSSWGMGRLLSFCKELAGVAGYDERIGQWGETRLPFSAIIGPSDIRIAVNFTDPYRAFSGTLHEAGHAVYAAGAAPAFHDNGLWVPLVGGYDEAMAVLWERMIGQDRHFWKYFFPRLQAGFEEFTQLSFPVFLAGFQHVKPDLMRAGSDELTYPLHILIRYKLEKKMLEGSLAARDLPKAWAECYQRDLQIYPAQDASGCLQDVHWSLGLVGYFPSYLLGSIMAAQLYRVMKVSGVLEPMAGGDFQPVRSWLQEHCYQQGRLYTPTQILTRVTGRQLDHSAYLSYLRAKYLEGLVQ